MYITKMLLSKQLAALADSMGQQKQVHKKKQDDVIASI